LAARIKKYKGRDIRRRKEPDVAELPTVTKSIHQIERWLGPGPERDLLRLLGLFNRPAPIDIIEAIAIDAERPIPDLTTHLTGTSQKLKRAVVNLRELKLLVDPPAKGPDQSIDTNATFRQQWAQELREHYPDSWREANSRLFDYYVKRPQNYQPDTLHEMGDLYQAIVHGCRANRHQEAFDPVYWIRIRHEEDGYSVTTLNAWSADLVALSNFFVDGDWERPSPQLDRMAAARACTEAAFDLRGHGRLDEAIGAQVISLRHHVDMGNLWNACDAAGNLSELRTLHGDLLEAEAAARRSIEFATKAGQDATDERNRTVALLTHTTNLATLGDVLHQRGAFVDAEEQFVTAERLYRNVRPQAPYLELLRGYHYCDLLLTLGRLDEVEARATVAAQAVGRPYGVALGHLALARRQSALVQRGVARRRDARSRMDDACSRLQQIGHSEMILRGLLASAELHRLSGELDLAKAVVTELLESAGDGQMKLLEADAQIQLAHVEATAGHMDTARVHLDISRGMVQAFGYNRRAAELHALHHAIDAGRASSVSSGGTRLSSAPARVAPSAADAEPFEREQRRFVELYLRCNPLDGTQLGIAGAHDAALPPVDPRVRADLFAELTTSAHALRDAAERSGVPDNIVDGELAIAGVRGMRIVEDALRPHARNPGVYLDGVVRGVYSLLARTDLSFEQKLEPLVARLHATPEFLMRAERHLSRAPRVLVDNAIGDAEGALQFLEQDLGDFVRTVPELTGKNELAAGRQRAIDAMRAFGQFVAGLIATSTDEFALGRAAFEALLHDVHHVRHDSDELVELGRSVVADLEHDLELAGIKAAGNVRWWECATVLEDRHPTRAALLDEYQRMLERAREFVQKRGLLDLARVGPLIVRATPQFARANLPFAAYVPAPPFASSGRGEFWVTLPAEMESDDDARATLRRHHPGRLLVACVHEAYPGHHAQFEHAAHVKRPVRHSLHRPSFLKGGDSTVRT
jgi:hypothetical protein